MKVCTDACLFGAWIANFVVTNKMPVKNCLDIGTGTGLLSLMVAQKNNDAVIDAVEIEDNAYEQVKENFTNSKWANKLQMFHADIKKFASPIKYDLILSNPPFYENELLSNLRNKNLAKHDEGLTLSELIAVTKSHLSASGYLAILLPYQRIEYFEQVAGDKGLYVQQKLLIRQTPSHNFFRGLLVLINKKTESKTNEMTIKDTQGNYTNEFIELLKDYYLYL